MNGTRGTNRRSHYPYRIPEQLQQSATLLGNLKVEGLRFRSPLVVYRTRLAGESHTTCNYSKQHGRLEDVTKRRLPGSYAGHGPRNFEGLKSAMLRICEHVRLNIDS